MKPYRKLKIHRIVAILIILASVPFVEFSILITLLIMGVGFIYDFIFRRCPHCGYHLDLRESINENTHCHGCGEVYSLMEN